MSQLTITTKTRPEIRRAVCKRRKRVHRSKHIKQHRVIGRGPASELVR